MKCLILISVNGAGLENVKRVTDLAQISKEREVPIGATSSASQGALPIRLCSLSCSTFFDDLAISLKGLMVLVTVSANIGRSNLGLRGLIKGVGQVACAGRLFFSQPAAKAGIARGIK